MDFTKTKCNYRDGLDQITTQNTYEENKTDQICLIWFLFAISTDMREQEYFFS